MDREQGEKILLRHQCNEEAIGLPRQPGSAEGIWFTSDLHLGHESAIGFTNRPFATIEEMNDALITNINLRVMPDDELWILGDVSYRTPKETVEALLGKIRCRHIHLVKGNHDKNWIGSGVFESVQDYKELKACGKKIALFHYPISVWNGMDRDWGLHLHGHLHSSASYNEANRAQGIRAFDVGVDANGYAPVSLATILEFFADTPAGIRERG